MKTTGKVAHSLHNVLRRHRTRYLGRRMAHCTEFFRTGPSTCGISRSCMYVIPYPGIPHSSPLPSPLPSPPFPFPVTPFILIPPPPPNPRLMPRYDLLHPLPESRSRRPSAIVSHLALHDPSSALAALSALSAFSAISPVSGIPSLRAGQNCSQEKKPRTQFSDGREL